MTENRGTRIGQTLYLLRDAMEFVPAVIILDPQSLLLVTGVTAKK